MLYVSEIFGPTLQGEGPNQGKAAMFLRLGGCNLACRWCDTAYTWDHTRYRLRDEIMAMSEDEVGLKLATANVDHLVITGGEPMLQQYAVEEVLERLGAMGWTWEIETNGTVAPRFCLSTMERTHFNVSPKLAHALNHPERAFKADVLRIYQPWFTAFKFVVESPADLMEVAALVSTCGIADSQVWIMPEGTDAATITKRMQQLAEPVAMHGWNLSNRLHINLWGNERGR